MSLLVLWEAIAGIQYHEAATASGAVAQARSLIYQAGHGSVYVYAAEERQWYHYTKGIRGRINECEIPDDEVPKPFQLIVMLES